MNEFEKGSIISRLLNASGSNRKLELTERTFTNNKVQKLINSGEKFDVVILEQFLNDAHKIFAAHFNAPLILFTTLGANSWVNLLVGNPEPLSYVPDNFLGYPSHMTFYQRIINSLVYLFSLYTNHFYSFPQHNQLIKKYFPNGPDLYDVLYNASIVLVNSHPSVHQPVPYVPGMIDIGGFHIQPPKKLPKDLQQFLDDAHDGAIYFSLGSNIKSSNLPPEKLGAILKTFSKLKQKVLWKWEDDVLPGQPANVKLGKWLPQQDILAHPNIKLFITQGGILSTTETIYHGVPVLTLPVAADQRLNAERMVSQGIGLTLKVPEISEATFSAAIQELLNDQKYRQNAKARSTVFHDRIVSPMETAVYWVEYVIRHKGAPHLRVAALDLPWYKYHLLDVIATVLTGGLIAVYAFLVTCKTILKLVFAHSKRKTKTN